MAQRKETDPDVAGRTPSDTGPYRSNGGRSYSSVTGSNGFSSAVPGGRPGADAHSDDTSFLLTEADLVDLPLIEEVCDLPDDADSELSPPTDPGCVSDYDALIEELMRLHEARGSNESADTELSLAVDNDETDEWKEARPHAQEQIEYATQLAEASRRFQELFQGVPIACFCFDVEGRIIEWNRACEKVFSRPIHEVLECRTWEVVGRSQDREIIQAMVLSVVSGDAYENYEWEDVDEDGNARYFLANTYPLHGIDGVPTGGISASIDISARKYAEQALQDSEERWYLAVRGGNDGIWDWNMRTNLTYFSTRCAQILGYNEEDDDVAASREEWMRHVHDDDRTAVITAFQAHLERKTEYFCSEYRVVDRHGNIRWILDRGQALWNREGQPLRVAGSFTDITDRKNYEEQLSEAKGKLEELASRDGLTGIKNRRAFQDKLEMEYERALRYGQPLSIILLDVDKFKSYNDTFGHPAGDEVLRLIGNMLQAVTRESDFVARYGGEEFVMVLPMTGPEAAMRVAERCRSKIEHHHWRERLVTASFGVASIGPGAVLGRDELVQAADNALYASKESGRNRITHAEHIRNIPKDVAAD